MSKPGEIKYKFSIRVLEERLSVEKQLLKGFSQPAPVHVYWGDQKAVGADGPYCDIEECRPYLQWQKANTDSCLYRIGEIEQSIEHLKTIVYE